MRNTVFFFLSFVTLLLASLLPGAVAAAEAPLAVTVSILPQKYFIEKVGGDAVRVTVMTAKGQDPHTYEPTAAQMQGIASADVYFAIGVPFETQWMPRFHSLNPAMRIVPLSEAVEKLAGKPDLALRDALPGKGRRHEHGHMHEHGLETDDPHIWLSPAAMRKTVPLIVAALSDKRPAQADEFARRGAALEAEIAALDARISEVFAPIPQEARLFMTFHHSWTYYAKNFDLREVSVELDGREPGPKSLALLMDFAKAANIRVIVADSMTAKASVEAIARDINAKVVVAAPLAEDWPGALWELSETLATLLAEPE